MAGPGVYCRNVRVVFDAEVPVFQLLGVPAPVQVIETFRRASQRHFKTLQECLEVMTSVSYVAILKVFLPCRLFASHSS